MTPLRVKVPAPGIKSYNLTDITMDNQQETNRVPVAPHPDPEGGGVVRRAFLVGSSETTRQELFFRRMPEPFKGQL
jgi:hypothetical protein